jgi:aryl-alcohol dehydrogenase-like predicted oxidoreductase
MRFRPLGGSGMAISAVSLRMSDSSVRNTPQAWRELVFTAFECGINAFEVVGRQPALVEGLGQAIQAVERRLLFIALRLGPVIAPNGSLGRDFSPESLMLSLESFLGRIGLEYADAVILDDPQVEELSPAALDGLKAMRESGRARMLGVAGDGPAIDAYISAGAFDLLATPFSLISGWKERLRLKAALERDMAVLGYDYYPQQIHAGGAARPERKDIRSTSEQPLAGIGTYAFLERTQNWTAEEICLAYAMTEPSLATVQIDTDRLNEIEAFAEVPERDLPTGVPAQIEMARFSPPKEAAKKARRA